MYAIRWNIWLILSDNALAFRARLLKEERFA